MIAQTASSPADRASALNMRHFTPTAAQTWLVRLMAREFYRQAVPERREAISAAYAALLGAPLSLPNAAPQGYPTVSIKGPPGHGKSTVARAAAEQLAAALGMNFISRLDGYRDPNAKPPGKGDLVFLKREMTGETSTLSTRGIFEREALTDGSSLTRRVPFEDFALARKAEYCVLLLDDLATALEHVQSSLLGLMRERNLDGESFDNFFVVTTGNLGHEDGASTQPGSSAIVGRSYTIYLEDQVDDFLARNRKLYPKSTDSDGWVLSFLESAPTHFSPESKLLTDSRSPRPQPRTWDQLLYEASTLVSEWRSAGRSNTWMGRNDNVESLIQLLEEAAAMSVGLTAARHYTSFCHARAGSADRFASALLESRNAFEERTVLAGIEAQMSDPVFRMRLMEAFSELSAGRFARLPAGNAGAQLVPLMQMFVVALEAVRAACGDECSDALVSLASFELGRKLRLQGGLMALPSQVIADMIADALSAAYSGTKALLASIPNSKLPDKDAFVALYLDPVIKASSPDAEH